jgi:hypothetical protein
MIPAPAEVKITDAELEDLGNEMHAKWSTAVAPRCTSFAPKGAPRWSALYSCEPIGE